MFADKVPFHHGLAQAIDTSIRDAHEMLGKAMPASVVEVVGKNNTIVKVKFELQSQWTLPEVTMPVIGPEYTRWPIKKGDKGVAVPSELYLGGMSGLGGGIATMTKVGNLSAMVWMPIGNTDFGELSDTELSQHVIYGPDGVVLKTLDGTGGKVIVSKEKVETKIDAAVRTEVDQQGFKVYIGNTLKFIVDAAGARFIGSGSFGINVTDTGTFIDGVNFLPHNHGGVQTGGSNTAGVNP